VCRYYTAQGIPPIDAEIVKKGHFWMETSVQLIEKKSKPFPILYYLNSKQATGSLSDYCQLRRLMESCQMQVEDPATGGGFRNPEERGVHASTPQ
jgi:hypothetical protein